MSRGHAIACLAGDGVGPELMGEATRVLAVVASLHGLALEDAHLPFGSEAFTRFGHPLPRSTREAYRAAEAVFCSSPRDPALDGVKADLNVTWRVSRVHGFHRDLLVVSPVGACADGLAVAHAFELAAARRGRLVSVGGSPAWRELVRAEAARRAGIEVRLSGVGEALGELQRAPGRFDVLVADGALADGLVDAAAHVVGGVRMLATAWLSEDGPGLFAPHVCDGAEVAGLGVADPAGTLLAASLLLGEGLRRRAAARTLERAVTAVAPSRVHGSRGFADAVIAALPDARTDTELFEEVWR